MISKRKATYDNAWQLGDIEGIVACFTEDSILISPPGHVAKGREENRKLFNNFLGNEAKNTNHIRRIT
ncbi:MAG TPA: nuclear transport factor 2 family protein [Saprospiraceae bacterium]|nr:nuclear transport factor 2 family protein [Saprospiraceae bacterium]